MKVELYRPCTYNGSILIIKALGVIMKLGVMGGGNLQSGV